MTRPVPVARPAALRAAVGRAWLLAGVLALIAGLLGMHVMTAGHASHGAPAGHTVVANSAGAAPTGHAPGASATDMHELAPATCGDSCPGAQESGAPCIPTAPSGPVTVAPPQATQAALPLLPSTVNAGSAYDYLPPGPTPCELSISRT